MNLLEKSLFSTNSIKIADHISPFWYTSGTLGPYFINTHFLFGNEKEANNLLDFITQNKEDTFTFLPELTKNVIDFYKKNSTFKNVIDFFYTRLSLIKEFRESEYISGGERRDWFFSPIIAHLANKKHLYIYKNLKVYSETEEITNINGSKVCHICDLVTKASSHKRAWIPAIKNISGKIIINGCIVNRDEGGSKLLEDADIKDYSAVIINNDFLENLLNNKIINEKQHELIIDFKKNPILFGKNFILNNADFLKKSLSNDLVKSKAQRCVNENPYNIDFEKLI